MAIFGYLTPAKVANLASAVLPNRDATIVATAIAMAESNCREGVVNSIGATGLWQILISAHPEYTTEEMKHGDQNAAAMAKISNGGASWSPWSTWTSGAYKKHLSAATRAVDELGPNPTYGKGAQVFKSPVTDPITGEKTTITTDGTLPSVASLNPMSGIQNVLKQFSDNIRNDFLIAIPVIVAIVLIIIGFIILNRQTIGTAAKVATKVATKGIL